MSNVPAARTGDEQHLRYVDVRPYTVPQRLEQLTGPDRGEVQPPSALTGTPRRRYRLDDDHDAELLYRTVIREASTVDELARYLNAQVLKQLWLRLVLPAPCRTRWEQRFPELAQPAVV
ncbi:MAG: hypothetical protein ACRDTE_27640 [Pseudonocardiaceae bacterium]